MTFPSGCTGGENEEVNCLTVSCGGFKMQAFPNALYGIKGIMFVEAQCEGEDPSLCIESTPLLGDNVLCCDQDHDGFGGTSCGGTDCNDDPLMVASMLIRVARKSAETESTMTVRVAMLPARFMETASLKAVSALKRFATIVMQWVALWIQIRVYAGRPRLWLLTLQGTGLASQTPRTE